MANFYKQDPVSGEFIPFKLIDNGDGTFSESGSGSGAASNQVQGATPSAILTGTATANNTDLIASMDVSAYRQLAIQCNGFGTATVQVQFSLDAGVTWFASLGFNMQNGAIATGINSNSMHTFAIPPKALMRIRTTTYVSGTIAAFVGLSASTLSNAIQAILYSSTGANFTTSQGTSDALSTGSNALFVLAYQTLYDAFNNNWERVRVGNVFKTVALGSGTTETTIWTPTSGKKFNLMGMVLTCGAASTLTFKDNTAGSTIFITRGGADQPIVIPQMSNGLISAAANNVLTVTRGTACTLDGVVWGTEE